MLHGRPGLGQGFEVSRSSQTCLLALLVLLGCERRASTKRGGRRPAPVEVAPVRRGPMAVRRTFSGTLEAHARMTVAPKVAGRIERIDCDLADTVERGQVVARLDDDEFVQAVAVARAELAVTRASLGQAEAAAEAASRELKRAAALRERGILSEAQLDQARVEQQAKQAQREMAAAQIERAKAALQAARIQLGYTRITARWTGGSDKRVVAERLVDVGDTVAANAPLLTVVELSPITGVMFVAEADYVHLKPGQPVVLTTDAYPNETFAGHVERVAPVFREDSRQARVELQVDNDDQRLKPGMFVRVTVDLMEIANATIVPEAALTKRKGATGVFLVDQAGTRVRWREVRVGARSGNQVQLEAQGIVGRVVTLGQQLIEDQSAITLPPPSVVPDGGPSAPGSS